MNEATRERFIEHGLAEFPKEACGLIIVRKGKEVYVPCRNMAANPERDFVIPPEDYAAAEDQGEIIAVAHTHPNAPARASDADRASCEDAGLPWFILSIVQDLDDPPVVGEIVRIEPEGFVAPLVGRRFVHGVHDCYALIRDWYAQERGITLSNPYREDEWWEKGGDMYYDNYEAEGFVEAKGPMQVGDVILMQVRSPVANHAGVYIGDGLFLHHMYGRLSTRDVYGGYWAEVTVKIIRRAENVDDAS